MAIEKITIVELLQLVHRYPVLDVRSPGEYTKANIPGAWSLPLFSDEERKITGTAYKQESKEAAVKIGLAFFGKKMVQLLEEAEKIIAQHTPPGPAAATGKEKTVIVHCWRGGMRSAGVAWLLDLYGFKVYTLQGGYKSFRRWCVLQFTRKYPFKIIGGYTGSGKTGMLNVLKEKGHNVIDLEALAHHKGSVFGHLGEAAQPTQEMFENGLALALSETAPGKDTWLEDESMRIGKVTIPVTLFNQLQKSPVYFFEIPFDQRLNCIVESYGRFEKEQLTESILKLKKRLGGLATKTALLFLEAGDRPGCFSILLRYYDKYYLKSLAQKNGQAPFVQKITAPGTEAVANVELLLQQQESNVPEKIMHDGFNNR
ncbi:MAG TPA: tRNA 2-selenouridine(34) synthase MnmH [Chitinophagaceae bacterium]|jgi:tRNA 2-selenouridine synthase